MYNLKINKDGTYRSFLGYTIISMIKNDLNFIEIFLRDSTLSKYFSPLPSNTYHMTLFNIWCHKSPLLKYHDDILKKNYKQEIYLNYKEYYKSEKLKYWFDPLKYLDNLMISLGIICKNHKLNDIESQNINLIISASTLQLAVLIDKNMLNKINNFRNDCKNICGKEDKGLKFHITLAYQYKDIPENDYNILNKELETLSNLIKNIKINFNDPEPYIFDSMINYISHKTCCQ